MVNPSFDQLITLASQVNELSKLTAWLADRVVTLEEKVKKLEDPHINETFQEKYERVRGK